MSMAAYAYLGTNVRLKLLLGANEKRLLSLICVLTRAEPSRCTSAQNEVVLVASLATTGLGTAGFAATGFVATCNRIGGNREL